jgi:outer membrane protein assembly factor BamC
VNPIFKLTLTSVAIALTACGTTLEADKVDYRSASSVRAPTLDVPPDLTQLSKDTHYAVVGGTVSASALKSGQPAATTTPTIAPAAVGDVRIERAGDQRWLVVKRPAEKLWEPVRGFWQENGFLLTMDQNTLGIMETDWAENRAKIPQDFIRASLGKLLDSLYSTAERDKFRTRLERNATGETEIFISHRGMIETLNSSKDNTVWQPRAADPELEAEFLRRLRVKLGSTEVQAKTLVAGTDIAKKTAVTATENGQQVVRIEDGFDSAWRRVGLALDRTGFTVEDRDRKQGVYFVRYVPLNADNAEPGFFSKLFSSSDKSSDAAKFQIAVRTTGNVTTVSVLNSKGAVETSPSAQRIVKVIADDIR